MHRQTENFDEYILAAYLSGDVPNRLRQEIASYLNGNPGARELLGMATDALDAAESGDGASYMSVGPEFRATGPAVSDARLSGTLSSLTFWKTATAISLATIVLAIALLANLYTNNGSGNRRGDVVKTDAAWTPELEVGTFGVSWSRRDDASFYRVHIAKRTGLHEVLTLETEGVNITPSQIAHIPTGQYQVWIETADSNGRTLYESSRADVVLTRENSD